MRTIAAVWLSLLHVYLEKIVQCTRTYTQEAWRLHGRRETYNFYERVIMSTRKPDAGKNVHRTFIARFQKISLKLYSCNYLDVHLWKLSKSSRCRELMQYIICHAALYIYVLSSQSHHQSRTLFLLVYLFGTSMTECWFRLFEIK